MGCGCNRKQGKLPRARIPRNVVKKTPTQQPSKTRGTVPSRPRPRPGRKSR